METKVFASMAEQRRVQRMCKHPAQSIKRDPSRDGTTIWCRKCGTIIQWVPNEVENK